MDYTKFINWFRDFHNIKISSLRVSENKLRNSTQALLCELVENTPNEIMDEFINSGFYMDEFRSLVSLDSEKGIGYKEDDVDEIFYLSLEDAKQYTLKSIIDNILVFIYSKDYHKNNSEIATKKEV